MSANDWSKNHTVTAGYVRLWQDERNEVDRHHLSEGVRRKGPRSVGYQSEYWGSPNVASKVEPLFGSIESDALRLLQNLKARWPLGGKDRAVLGQFPPIHMVRMPSLGGHMSLLGERSAKETLAEGAAQYELDEEQDAEVAAYLRDPGVHVNDLLRQIPRIASVLCSMHWSVVEFSSDWLITGDQPVVLLPPGPHEVSPATAVQPFGAVNTLEGRFALGPRRLLLLTWLCEPDELWLPGGREHAVSANCAVRAQALEEWFSKPGTNPPCMTPMLEERIFPISVDRLPGYTVEQAGSRSTAGTR